MNTRSKFALHLSTVHSSGDPRIVHKELSYLAASGWNTAYVCTDPHPPSSGGIKIVKVPRSRNRFFRFLIDGPRAWRAAIRLRPAVIHFHDPELLFWVPWAARRTRAALVFDVHEFYLESISDKRWIPGAFKGFLRIAAGILERAAARRLAGFVVVSEHMAGLYRRYGKPIAVVPNYPKKSLFPLGGRDPELAGRYAGRRVIVYVGSLSERRGMDTVLDAFVLLRARVLGAFLLLIGGFDSAPYEVRFRDRARSLLPGDAYEILGRVPHSQVYKYLRIADVGVYLPGNETRRYRWGEPTKLFEYCAAGLPVVVSDVEAKRRVLSRTKNGILVPPGDPAAAAAAMAKILEDAELAARFSRSGREAFEREFCWESCSHRLTDFYNTIIARRFLP